MKLIFTTALFFTFIQFTSAQSDFPKTSSPRFSVFISAGAAGSFFVRSYYDLPTTSNYAMFDKKRFLGLGQEIGVGYRIRNATLKVGLQHQQFSRKVNFDESVNGVQVFIDHPIIHQNFIWFAGVEGNITRGRWDFAPGAGLYYLRPKQEEILIASNTVHDHERNYNNSRLEEGGAYVEFTGQYQLYPHVSLGLKGQYFYTVSTGASESVTLMPTLRVGF